MTTMGAEETTDSRPRRPPLDQPTAWRLDCFLRLGFLYDDALTLAKTKADHYAVERAVKAGCTPAQALAIFV